MTPQQRFNQLQADSLIEAFAQRNISALYCETKADALSAALALVPPGATVSCGGSATLHEIGLHAALHAHDCDFWNPDAAQGGRAKDAVARQALSADCYFMSANAIAATGELVNIDGYGNRTAALIFGPQKVIVVAGMNKVEPTLDAALLRARRVAAPLCMLLFKQDYASFEELQRAADEACRQTVVTASSVTPGRIHVLLVGERLGL